jgi:pimeloyl-ACP methyl ester carboxylesterase
MPIMAAAELARRSYLGAAGLPPVDRTLDRNGVQAYLLTEGTLVIPGTNEPLDWLLYNLNIEEPDRQPAGFDDVSTVMGNAVWHAGFARHARAIVDFLGQTKPDFIIGHSLGAASAQILGCIYGVPTVGFASPKPRKGNSTLANEGWVINFLRNTDSVCYLPPKNNGFRQVGSVEVMTPPVPHLGLRHKMDHYIDIMGSELAAGRIPAQWPR